MKRYILRRLGQGLLTFVAAITVVFLMLRIGPDWTTLIARAPGMGPQARQQLLEAYGLNEPLYIQYVDYLTSVMTGNLGISFRTGRQVSAMIATNAWRTVLLMTTGLFAQLVIGIPLGVYISDRRDSMLDYVSQLFGLVGLSFPPFFLAFILLWIFAGVLNVLPSGGIANSTLTGLAYYLSLAEHLLLPALTMAFLGFGYYMLLLRSSFIEVMQKDYITFAVCKGTDRRTVLWKHALRNAVMPTITVIGLHFGFMFGGAVLIETVFRYPGIGRLLVESALQRDYPVVQGVIVVMAATVILMILLTDLTYAWLDPRIRYGDDDRGETA